MAALTYKDDHNKVAYLEKSKGSEEYHQILDFLNGSTLRYALTHCPQIVYDSLVKQFWASATVHSLEDGFQELVAIVDGNEIVVNESSIRTHLQLDDKGGLYVFTQQEIIEGLICLSDRRIYNFSKMILNGMIGNLKFEGDHMPLLAAMLPRENVGAGAAVAAEHPSDTYVFTMKMEILLESASNKLLVAFKMRHSMRMLVKHSRSQDGIDDKDNDKGSKSRSQSMKEQAYNKEQRERPRPHELNDKSNLIDLMKEFNPKQDPIPDPKKSASWEAAQFITDDEITLAKALAELKSAKLRTQGIAFRKSSESITTTPTFTSTTAATTITAASTRPKDKGIVIHEQEQAPTPIRQREKTLKHLKEKRRRGTDPPTRAQQRSIITELVKESSKKVETKLEENSKKAEVEITQEISSKRAGEKLEQESSKKQKVEEDKESEELNQCLENSFQMLDYE
ncbi:hypothetical protein Tco_0654256 [Tanacetum coccineum]|uniref:Xylulose kinase-1 n=1 Tax=Tanacetum coccineum TaxID=301880 RepID=A0ABQ4X2W8_9ASTR